MSLEKPSEVENIEEFSCIVQSNQTEMSTESNQSSKHEIVVTTCPVQNVTVFMDRAEVNRKVVVSMTPGENEVLVQNLPAVIDKDSIRVTCFGEATIVEVAYQERAISEKVETEDELNQKKTGAEKLQSTVEKFEVEKSRLAEKIKTAENEKDVLEKYRVCISSQKEDKVVDVLETKNVENLLSFLDIYKDRSDRLSEELFSLNEKLNATNKQIEVMKFNLLKMKPCTEKTKTGRNISILLDVKAKGEVSLIVSYVVSNASWTPLYDVRAFNKDSSVQILYFANIRQNTGEDWEDAKLSLSTAMPSVGGSPPDLPPQILDIERPVYLLAGKSRGLSFEKKKKRSSYVPPPPGRNLRQFGLFSGEDSSGSYDALVEEQALPTAQAVEGITSTNFEIARLATIQSDDVAHKVSIAQIDFSPQFEYLSSPKAVSHAFLKIKAKNDSAYAMLAGDANVFLDNNFITKSELPAVSPMEEFEVALGADPAVKVTYKPLKKFEEKTGIVSKAQVYNFHQQIEIKNTKLAPIRVKVQDQCPRSENEKIKVTLQEPDIKIPKGTAKDPTVVKVGDATLYTNDYRIEWMYNIAPSETKTINLKYRVEHPLGAAIKGL